MAKGRGQHRKKESRRERGARRPAALTALAASTAPSGPRRGVEATRGPVSGADRAWAADYGRRQAQAVGARFGPSEAAPPDVFLLAPLTTRTVEARDEVLSVQMGLPIVATRAGSVAVAPDKLAVAVLRMPEADPGSAMAMLGLGQAPDLPQPELLFAAQLPGESMKGTRAADAIAWYLARAVEAGDVAPQPRDLAQAVGEALALLRPHAVSRDVARLDAAALDAYEGYGAEADEEAVPLDIAAAPARGGISGLPSGVFLGDSGAPLAPLLADLRDYVIGLWPYEYFGLEDLTTNHAGGGSAALAALSDLVRRLDDVLAQSIESEEAALAAEGQPPAWIAEQTASYREARQTLRATRTTQELLPRLGPILFDLEIPPPDYRPEGWVEEEEEDDEE